jgi:hypothetical protein
MTKPRKRLDKKPATKTADKPRQKSLLDYIREVQAFNQQSNEGTLNIREQMRQALLLDIKECKLSPAQIAGEMNHLLGTNITTTTIYSWTAKSKPQNRIPGEYVASWCVVTGSMRTLRVINEAAGAFVLPGPDALRSEIQKWAEKEKEARAEKRKRELFLKEMEEGN